MIIESGFIAVFPKFLGIVNLNVVPFPNSLVKEIFPPCILINFLVKGNPNPVPGVELTKGEPILLNSLNIRS